MSINYTCSECGREIEEGQFIAVIGQAPASGMSTPIGRADKIFNDTGRIYCADCLQLIGAENLVARVRQPQQ
jgi:hypothetical protein